MAARSALTKAAENSRGVAGHLVDPDTTIAVIGVSCRFPGAENPDGLWRLLAAGESSVSEVPPGRWSGPAAEETPRWGAFLERPEEFDAAFFGISPREAPYVDPQQRLALELGWEALENARIVPDRVRGTRLGTFVGVTGDDYAQLLSPHVHTLATQHALPGVQRGVIANRLAAFIGARGPSITVDSAQSSSLVALHLACGSLRGEESDTALVCGVNLHLLPQSVLLAARLGALSPRGRCFTFDERADGYVPGEGGGAVVLKRLRTALADGDRILCLVRGSATTNDPDGETLTAPTVAAQADALARAYRHAGIAPDAVDYVELHGTGTPTGDPVEAAALGEVIGRHRPADRPLAVGSVKTNIGHLSGAAGIAGFIKTVLALAHRQLPPSLNFDHAHPRIPLDALNLRVHRRLGPWPGDPAADRSLVAGVSSFGMGGTNCHVVLSDWHPEPGPARREPAVPAVPWLLSGRGEAALRDAASRLANSDAVCDPEVPAADVARSLASSRSAFERRAAIVAPSRDGLLAGVRALAEGSTAPGVLTGTTAPGGVGVVFSGQGSERGGMGAGLARFPAFAEALAEVCQVFDEVAGEVADEVGLSEEARERFGVERGEFGALLRRVMAEGAGDGEPGLGGTGWAQAGLFAFGVAAWRLVSSLGVVPSVVAGHSVGELIAAHVAGVWSLRDAARVVLARGWLMEPMLEQFGRMLGAVEFAAPRLAVTSNVTGRVAEPELLRDPAYWVRHVEETVRFADEVSAMRARGISTFLEIGPGTALTTLIKDSVPASAPGAEQRPEVSAVPLCRRDLDEGQSLVEALAQLWARGTDVDWEPLLGTGRQVDLPTYPFQRRRFWLDVDAPAASASASTSAPAAIPASVTAPSEEPSAASPRTARTPRTPRTFRELPDLLELVREQAGAIMRDSGPIDAALTFRDLGFNSLMTEELAEALAARTGLPLRADVVFGHPTPAALAEHLRDALTGTEHTPDLSERRVTDEPLAIVGMACRYPGGVATADDLWRLVASGGDAIGGLPTDRGWAPDILHGADSGDHTPAGGFLYDAGDFDADFFGVSPREALAMDPQQRLLLETSWEALEQAGMDPGGLRGSATGVYVGATTQDYGPRAHHAPEHLAGHILTGSTPSVLSGRVAYTFGFEGPAVTVDTACSSSLVALHLAGRALRSGECDLALASGVAVMATPGMFTEFGRQGGLAADGRCKPFSAAADGTAWGEGVGVLVLERLSDARRHGHRVLAVVRGSAVNQDGASNGLTAPSGPSQQRVIRAALADAGLSAGEVDAVEAHGTGTRLGDPIEAQALAEAYGRGRDPERPLWLGSLKSNIGHTQAAAGVGGVIKMVQAMRHGVLPASLHAGEPTPRVAWESSGLELLAEPREWPGRDGRVRRAGVSSFGISGTNAHVIVEEAPAVAGSGGGGGEVPVVPWVLSGRGGAALRGQAERLAAFVEARPEVSLTEVGASLVAGRAVHEHRAVAVGATRDELLDAVRALARGTTEGGAVVGERGDTASRVVLVFPGQGSQWVGMAAGLLADSPVFAARMRECAAALQPHLEVPLLEVLGDSAALERVDVVQPVLWAVMVSLAEVWRSYGVEPSAVVGHSQGEIAAAVVAGALSLEGGARVVALRSRAIAAELAGRGGMAVVRVPADEARRVIGDLRDVVSVAAVNGPATTVVSGTREGLDELEVRCGREGVRLRRVAVDYASHSAQVDALRERILADLAPVRARRAEVPFFSTVTGAWLEEEVPDAAYWADNLRRPVRFEEAVRALAADGFGAFVECSPHAVLTGDIQHTLEAAGQDAVVVGSLLRDDGGPRRLLTSLGEAFVHGVPVDWAQVFAGSGARGVDLPTYAFQHERYWFDTDTGTLDVSAAGLTPARHPLLGAAVRTADGGTLVLTGRIAAQTHRWLYDHTVATLALLPGTALLELAVQAGDRYGTPHVGELVLHAPMALPGPGGAADLQITVTASGEPGRATATVHARPATDDADAPWTHHATAALAETPAARARPVSDWAATWPPAGATPTGPGDVYADLADTGYTYGPAFQGLSRLWVASDGTVYAEAHLPERDQDADATSSTSTSTSASTSTSTSTGTGTGTRDGDGYALHPALLDSVLHAVPAGRVLGGELRLPYAWGDVALYAAGARALRARIARTGEGEVTIDLADGAGRPVGNIGSLTMRPADTARLGAPTEAAARSLFAVEWDALSPGDSPPTGHWALLAGDDGPARAALRDSGALPPTAAAYRDVGHLRTALDAGAAVPDVLVWLVPHADGDPVTDAHAHAAAALETARALLLDDRMTTTRLLAVTGGATGPDAVTDVAAATVWGLLRTAQTETPGRFLLVDTDRQRESLRLLPAVAASAEPQVALRAGRAHTPRLSRAAAVADATTPFGPDGTVLFTGASGRIGGLLARHLVHEHGVRELLFVSRRGADATRDLTAELTAAGCAVTTVACDPADRGALAAALASVRTVHPLTAVVHAAGATDDGAVTSLTADQLAKVLRPKVDAAWHLHELTREEPLTAFVVLSSVSGVLGTAGQANYAAANAFLDALAAHRSHLGLPGQAHAWGLWDQDASGGGMASGLDDTDRTRLARLGVVPLPEDEALALFDRAVADPRPLMVPVKLDVRPVRERAARNGVPALLRRIVRPPRATGGDSPFADRLAALAPDERPGLALDLVRAKAAAVLGHAVAGRVPATRPFQDIGFDSLGSLELRNRLNTETGLRLPVGLLFDHPTPTALATFLVSELAGAADATPDEERPAPTASTAPTTPEAPIVPAAPFVPTAAVTAKVTASPTARTDEPLAIVGMACRYPGGATSPEALWELVSTGADGIGPFPVDRGWDLDGLYHPDPGHPGTSYTREGCFLHDAGDFDAGFFGISPREALAMDPQQRLLLETSWEALEQAGMDPGGLRGSATGVYVGATTQDYGPRAHHAPEHLTGHALTGSTPSVLSGRVAYTFGFEGPAVTVDTACSSSLVALHLAGRALRSGECDLALASGVAVMVTPGLFIEFSQQRGLAADGRCKPFSAAADGTAWGEGVGVLVLERLSDARRHGHRVLAVVRGSAVNQDGASNGLTAPSGPSQQRVIRAALADAGLSAGEVDAVEAHGTGTTLGDPIEADALFATYGRGRDRERPLWLGSLKSNIGHTQAAAGVGGVIKVVQMMRHGVLPASPYAGEPTPHVDWSPGTVRLLAEPREWPGRDGRVRRAGVSSFGISGTNAHVIVEEAPAVAGSGGGGGEVPVVPWVLSGRGGAALRGQAERLAAFVEARPEVSLTEVGASLVAGRAVHEHRAVAVGATRDELLDAVRALARGTGDGGQVRDDDAEPRVVFVFPGQGSQWVGMAAGLLADSPVFAARMRECAAALEGHLDLPLLEALGDAAALERVDVVQPVLWAVMVSLAEVWRSYGVEPSAVVGHSQGEIAAAVVAGALSLEGGARVVALRSRAIAAELAGQGGMAAVATSEDEVRRLMADIKDVVSVAAVNGPATTVVSGTREGLDELEVRCGREGVRLRRVAVDYASHSAQVDALRERILADLAPVRARRAEVPFFSTVTGAWLEEVPDAAYWADNLRRPVRFEEAVRALAADGFGAFVECSPHPVLTAAVQETLEAAGHEAVVAGTLRRDDGGAQRLFTSFGEVFVHGVPVDWAQVFAGSGARGVDLPTYAFQHERYWWDPATLRKPAISRETAGPADDTGFWEAVESGDTETLMDTLDIDSVSLAPVLPALRTWHRHRTAAATVASWCYRTRWVPASLPDTPTLTGAWLLAVPAGSAAADRAVEVAAAVRDHGGDVTTLELPATATREDIARRLPGDRYAGVLSLLSVADGPATADGVPRTGLTATVALFQALGDTGSGAPLWCLTHDAVTATDQDLRTHRDSAAAQHMVWGLGRILALEHPERFGGLVDLPARPDARTGRLLAALLSGTAGEDQVALRPSGALVRRLARAAATGSHPAWRPRGTVLVTGGTGGLGARVARHLAGSGAEHLVLAGRRGPDAPGAAELCAELEATGVRVTVAACDVGDRADLARLLDAVPGDCPLTAVVHTAAVLDDAVVEHLTPGQIDRVTRAKADGAWHLHELTRGSDLDAFVLFSSVAGTLGASGQGNYAPGNAYLDALAEQRHALGLPATSVAWSIWDERGMATEGGIGTLARRHGLPVMAPDLAATALTVVAGEPAPTVMVADVEWDRFHVAYTATRPSPFLADLPDVRRLTAVTPADEPAPGAATGSGDLVARLTTLGGRAEQQAVLLTAVREQVAVVLGHAGPDAVDPGTAYRDLGFDSVTAVELRNRLNSVTGLRLPSTIVFDHPNARALATHLHSEILGDTPAPDTLPTATTPTTGAEAADPVVIVGMSCRFPGDVRSPRDLWQLLQADGDAITPFPDDRGWDLDALHAPGSDRPGTSYTREGGFLYDAGDFDAAFFGISPREALAMDPQQRLLLETSWEALEGAGIDPTALRGTRAAVFTGTNGGDYLAMGPNVPEEAVGYVATGNIGSVLSGRVAYTLGTEGPAITVDTACSSSLVALHLAVRSLQQGECDLALTGGVTVMSTPGVFTEFTSQGGLAADGRSKAFAANADGAGFAEGVGVLVVERLSDARRNGHRVWAVVRGSAVNQDGASNGLTAPSGPAQQRVIRAALADAGLSAGEVDVVEAHGTGTKLGDPIEAGALLATYGRGRDPERPLWLGSVKSNIGHTQAAAGVAGVIKTVLALHHAQLPRTLHADEPSPHVDWSSSAVRLLTEPRDWPDIGRPRRAGVSSFGVSGTNAHVILEQSPDGVAPENRAVPEDTVAPWTLSAKSEAALREQARRLLPLLTGDTSTTDIGHALATTRAHFDHRAVVLGASTAERRDALDRLATGQDTAAVVRGTTVTSDDRVVFVFPGQGSQWVGMAVGLLEGSGVFAERFAACASVVDPLVGWSLVDVVRGVEGAPGLDRVDVVQPVLWAVMVSLAEVWRSFGVEPAAVVGHSQGEIAAAVVAGVLSLEDGARVVVLRSRALVVLSGRGGMVSVAAGVDVVRGLV
ncbi:type I polyketide synthase, partial [Streptomyces sp. NPDC096310]|uniref:type I polyketide synthase n=1 Tax=Streptomyces sp. NPDC096310 TaxID=3366082 RepID=UPI003818B2D7